MVKLYKRWRRFTPQKSFEPRHDIPRSGTNGVFSDAWRIVDEATRHYDVRSHGGIDQLDQEIERRKTTTHSAAEWLALVLLQTPRAARAQMQMDAHKHNYHDRHERLFELIDYNDSFVNAVLALPKNELAGFTERLRKASQEVCRRLQAPNFSDEQFDGITRGLAREIAVYRAALELGYKARMTSRSEDAFGIDMVLEDEEGRVLNIDVKTPSAFRHRLGELEREGRLSEQEFLRADQVDYFTRLHKHQGSHAEKVLVTLLCVRPERLGEIVNFEFADPAALGALLGIIAAETDHNYE